jgi:hypothetical protein
VGRARRASDRQCVALDSCHLVSWRTVMRQLALLALVACTRPAETRALDEAQIGTAALADASVVVDGGLATVRELADHRLELWAQSPVLAIQLTVGNTAGGDWTIVVRNTPVDAVLDVAGDRYTRDPDQHPTVGIFHVPLAAWPISRPRCRMSTTCSRGSRRCRTRDSSSRWVTSPNAR